MSKKLLDELRNDPDTQFVALTLSNHARFKRGRRWKEAEPHILKRPSVALKYATELIKGRWPELEPLIFTDKKDTIKYYDHIMSFCQFTREDCKRYSEAMS